MKPTWDKANEYIDIVLDNRIACLKCVARVKEQTAIARQAAAETAWIAADLRKEALRFSRKKLLFFDKNLLGARNEEMD